MFALPNDSYEQRWYALSSFLSGLAFFPSKRPILFGLRVNAYSFDYTICHKKHYPENRDKQNQYLFDWFLTCFPNLFLLFSVVDKISKNTVEFWKMAVPPQFMACGGLKVIIIVSFQTSKSLPISHFSAFDNCCFGFAWSTLCVSLYFHQLWNCVNLYYCNFNIVVLCCFHDFVFCHVQNQWWRFFINKLLINGKFLTN